MMFVELQYDDFTNESFIDFWGRLEKLGFRCIDIVLNTETATLIAVNSEEAGTIEAFNGVKLNAYSVMLRWDKLSESWVSDKDYYSAINAEAKSIIAKAKELKPYDICIKNISID